MKQINFGKTGEKVSELCLGTMLMGTSIDKKTSFEILDHYTNLGGNILDTANCYAWWIGKGEYIGDESEIVLGEWMKQKGNRDKVFLASKVGARLKDPYGIRGVDGVPEWERIEYEGLSPEVIRRGIEDSLRRLKTDYIDLYYTHVYDTKTPIEETLYALNGLVKEGKVKYIGCSNLSIEQLKEARSISSIKGYPNYVALQQEYSYLHPRKDLDAGVNHHADVEMFDYVRDNEDITFFAYSPLLKGIYNSEEKRKSYYNWRLFDTEESKKKLEVIDKISKEQGVTGNQLVLAWLRYKQPKIAIILGFSNKEQYMENINSADIILSNEQLTALNALDK